MPSRKYDVTLELAVDKEQLAKEKKLPTANCPLPTFKTEST
jgi:hypothetical protein